MALVNFTWKFPAWEKKVKRHRKEIMIFVAAIMQTNRAMMFDAQGASNGHAKWKAWSDKYAKRQEKRGRSMILNDTGTLRKSLAPETLDGKPGPDGIVKFKGDVVTIGTNVAYAGFMNDGTKYCPPRPFNKWNKADKKELSISIKNKLIQVLNK